SRPPPQDGEGRGVLPLIAIASARMTKTGRSFSSPCHSDTITPAAQLGLCRKQLPFHHFRRRISAGTALARDTAVPTETLSPAPGPAAGGPPSNWIESPKSSVKRRIADGGQTTRVQR